MTKDEESEKLEKEIEVLEMDLKRKKFILYLNKCDKEVETWPEWKMSLLGKIL